MTKSERLPNKGSLTRPAGYVNLSEGGDRLMSTIVVSASDWSLPEFRKQTLREARKEARAGKSKVVIKVAYPKGLKVLVATVDARFFKP